MMCERPMCPQITAGNPPRHGTRPQTSEAIARPEVLPLGVGAGAGGHVAAGGGGTAGAPGVGAAVAVAWIVDEASTANSFWHVGHLNARPIQSGEAARC